MCLDEIDCRDMKWIPFNDECLTECPSGYEPKNTTKGLECTLCSDDECIKKCVAMELRSVASTDILRGCTIIMNDLSLVIKVDVKNPLQRLEENLGNITEIHGYLRVSS